MWLNVFANFLTLAIFLDRWVHDSSSSESLFHRSLAKLINNPFQALSISVNSIELDNHCHVRELYPVNEILPNSMGNSILADCAQPLEGVAFIADRNSGQSVIPLEGACSFGIRTNELIKQCKRNKFFVNYPLKGVKFYAQNFGQSALSWFNSFNVIFPACFLICRPFWIFLVFYCCIYCVWVIHLFHGHILVS